MCNAHARSEVLWDSCQLYIISVQSLASMHCVGLVGMPASGILLAKCGLIMVATARAVSMSLGKETDLKRLDGVCHAGLAQGGPDGSIARGGVEGVQVVPHCTRKYHWILHPPAKSAFKHAAAGQLHSLHMITTGNAS